MSVISKVILWLLSGFIGLFLISKVDKRPIHIGAAVVTVLTGPIMIPVAGIAYIVKNSTCVLNCELENNKGDK